MATVRKSSPVELRQLTSKEREHAFATTSGYDLSPYVDAVREMEGGVGYAITLNGLPASALKRRMNKAADALDLKLRWAKASRTATEAVVELSA